MIALIILIYLVLRYIFEVDRENLFKIMILVCLVNLAPLLIYAIFSIIYGGFNVTLLVWMTIV